MQRQSPIVIPQRILLPDQTAAGIRQAIEQGTWSDYLPSERRLCELFQVSRPTIRGALRALAKAGYVDIGHGRRTRLLARHRRQEDGQGRVVGLVVQEELAYISSNVHQMVSRIQLLLAEHGIPVEMLVCLASGARAQRRKLEAFLHQHRVFCCVLLSASDNVKRWFVEHSFPALVLGSCDASIPLPSIDIDFRSISHHAAGVFLRHGHRRLAMIMRNTNKGGDNVSAEGFEEAVARWNATAREPASAVVVQHNGTTRNLIARLDALFNSPTPPTALLVVRPMYVFVVLVYLLQRGLAVPGQVALIARDQDAVFEILSPAVAHYQIPQETFVHRVTRLALKLVNDGNLKAKQHLVVPEFIEGGTCRVRP
ncbi:MAG: substrate-binding domain-containing protein [Opitutaceae bacterium]|nr:substrate-binding domain-containing protein [Opitutaceae bacterium]